MTSNAPITTTGAGAYGVIAQSVASGGGLVMNGTSMVLKSGNSSGSAGAVTVTIAKGVSGTTSGNGSNAAYLSASMDPTLVNNRTLTGGPGGSAVVFDAPTNEFDNDGTASTADGVTGLVVQSLSGATTIVNGANATLLGSIKLAAGGNNLVQNLAGGTILAGPSLDLGGTGVLQNAGTLATAGTAAGTTEINGALMQTSGGSLVIKFDQHAGLVDHITIDGSAQLAGTIVPQPLNPGLIAPGTVSLGNFLSASGGLNLSGLTLGAPSAILSYGLSSTGDGLSLTPTANFAPAGLSAAASSFGRVLSEAQSEGGTPLTRLLTAALIRAADVTTLDRAYQTAGNSGVSAVPATVLETGNLAMIAVTDRLDSWRLGDGYTGVQTAALPVSGNGAPMAYAASSSHVWVSFIGADASGGTLSSSYYGLAAGVDTELTRLPVLVGASFIGSWSSFTVNWPSGSGQGPEAGASVYAIGKIGPGYVCFRNCLRRRRRQRLHQQSRHPGPRPDWLRPFQQRDVRFPRGDRLFVRHRAHRRTCHPVRRGPAHGGCAERRGFALRYVE